MFMHGEETTSTGVAVAYEHRSMQKTLFGNMCGELVGKEHSDIE